MTTFYNYLNGWWYPSVKKNIPEAPLTIFPQIKALSTLSTFTVNDLKLQKNNLKPIYPGPARNMPNNICKFTLLDMTKDQLNQILAVKLRKIPIIQRTSVFPPRHIVLQELLVKVARK